MAEPVLMISPCTQDVSIYHLLEYSEPLSAFICVRMPRTRLMNLVFWNCCSCQLKCGGRTPGLEARRVLHASAMSNRMSYVHRSPVGHNKTKGSKMHQVQRTAFSTTKSFIHRATNDVNGIILVFHGRELWNREV